MFCWKCGEKTKENPNFCPSCGAKFTGSIESNSDESSKKKLLEQKAWYRALKVFYLAAVGIIALIVLGVFWSFKPHKTLNEQKTSIVCNNGKSHAPSLNQIYVYGSEDNLDSYNDKKARILCNYDTLDFYSHDNEFIEKNYIFVPVYNYTTFSDWVDWIKGLIFAFVIFWLIAYLIKSGFFYISIGEKPKIRWLEKIYKQ